MRLATRMKMTYVIVFFLPLVLLAVTFLCLGRIEMNALEKKYGIEDMSIMMLFDPFEMLEQMSGKVIEDLSKLF